eukprot:m.159773 g.159773  ORF g.159773 m.159773 type:complete len:500 (+) comp15159_c0_seq2:89-1588(+)
MDSILNFYSERPVSAILVLVVVLLFVLRILRSILFRNDKAPPHVPSSLPWLGNIVEFGEKPVDFLLKNFNEYGPVFSFTMFGTDVTYLLGSEASKLFWSSHNNDLNAEDLYKNITVPVFGKGVVFDVPHKVFSEQKQMCKSGLTQERFSRYCQFIEEETNNYLERWGDAGEVDLYKTMQEIVVFTATRCLHGLESRQAFTENVAKLYHDLDGGFSPLAWFFPSWLPFPSFIKRDRAHSAIKSMFNEIIENRKKNKTADTYQDDLLYTFMTAKYDKVNNQRKLNSEETAGLLIALLMAGQHTSSTSGAWMGLYMCHHAGLQDRLYKEQLAAQVGDPLVKDDLLKMPLLHSCVRETLRLKPPIMQLMRRVRKPLKIEAAGKTFIIPKGNQVCVSPSVNGRNPHEWENSEEFVPDRFIDSTTGKVTNGEHINEHKFKWVPFGSGRHRCIGFEFAQLQIRSVWSTILRKFEIQRPDGSSFPPTNYLTMIHTPMEAKISYKRRK